MDNSDVVLAYLLVFFGEDTDLLVDRIWFLFFHFKFFDKIFYDDPTIVLVIFYLMKKDNNLQ